MDSDEDYEVGYDGYEMDEDVEDYFSGYSSSSSSFSVSLSSGPSERRSPDLISSSPSVMDIDSDSNSITDMSEVEVENDDAGNNYVLRSTTRNAVENGVVTVNLSNSDADIESVRSGEEAGTEDRGAPLPSEVAADVNESAPPEPAVDEIRLTPPDLQNKATDKADKINVTSERKSNKTSLDDDDGEDGMTCSVCLDVFTNSGPHRLVSLRCGHLFGNSCVERWLKSGCMGGAKRCPSCNKRANLKDIRVIYAKKLQVLDTSEKDRIQMELDKVKEEKSRLEVDLTKMKMNSDMQKKVIESLKEQIVYLERMKSKCSVDDHFSQNLTDKKTGDGKSPLILISRIDLSKSGGSCRVLAFSRNISLLVASQKSGVSLFPGFGIRKIDGLDLRPSTFVNLHSNAIRDLVFHSEDPNLLLSVSLDKTAKIFDNVSNTIVQTFRGDNLLWSCAWDASNPHRFMTGSQNGVVNVYDKRQTNEPVSTCSTELDTTPVVSLASIPPTKNTVLPQGGFLSCRLNAVYGYYEGATGQSVMNRRLVMSDGPFISLDYNAATQLILSSTRPSSRFPNTRHMLNQLASPSDQNFCNGIHVFTCGNSGQLMSRSCQLLMPDNDVWVVAHNESKNAVEMMSVNKNETVRAVPVTEAVYDLCPLKTNDSCLLGSLSGNTLLVHKIY